MLGMRAFKRLNVYEINRLNEHGGNVENSVFNFSLHCLELTVRFLRLKAIIYMNELHLKLFFYFSQV